ncbi:hypothetical protein GCM10010327_40150 [Streptomyces nitrosporeus]|nr:hypothetical protein GCM10010327_40150 [Streptomyces nitrosporeus]
MSGRRQAGVALLLELDGAGAAEPFPGPPAAAETVGVPEAAFPRRHREVSFTHPRQSDADVPHRAVSQIGGLTPPGHATAPAETATIRRRIVTTSKEHPGKVSRGRSARLRNGIHPGAWEHAV